MLYQNSVYCSLLSWVIQHSCESESESITLYVYTFDCHDYRISSAHTHLKSHVITETLFTANTTPLKNIKASCVYIMDLHKLWSSITCPLYVMDVMRRFRRMAKLRRDLNRPCFFLIKQSTLCLIYGSAHECLLNVFKMSYGTLWMSEERFWDIFCASKVFWMYICIYISRIMHSLVLFAGLWLIA